MNCKDFANFSDVICEKCVEGFAKYNGGDRDYCQRINPEIECRHAELKSNREYGAELECTDCFLKNQLLTN